MSYPDEISSGADNDRVNILRSSSRMMQSPIGEGVITDLELEEYIRLEEKSQMTVDDIEKALETLYSAIVKLKDIPLDSDHSYLDESMNTDNADESEVASSLPSLPLQNVVSRTRGDLDFRLTANFQGYSESLFEHLRGKSSNKLESRVKASNNIVARYHSKKENLSCSPILQSMHDLFRLLCLDGLQQREQRQMVGLALPRYGESDTYVLRNGAVVNIENDSNNNYRNDESDLSSDPLGNNCRSLRCRDFKARYCRCDRECLTKRKAGFIKALPKYIPAIGWLPNYKFKESLGDFSCGIALGSMSIAQGMAYALLADVPPEYGLYGSIFPLLIYAFLGTSRELIVGPTAIVSLLTAEAISSTNAVGDMLCISLLVGCFHLLLGICQIGFVVSFLSHPVLTGFTSAAAIVIFMSQVQYFIGVSISRNNNVFIMFYDFCRFLPETKLLTLGIGIISVLLLVSIKKFNQYMKWRQGIPPPLVLVVVWLLISWLADLKSHGVSILGNIPAGLKAPEIPSFTNAFTLLPSVLSIGCISFIESISIAKRYAVKRSYKIIGNQELFALGFAYSISSFFGSLPGSGSFSRTAVAASIGVKRQFAGFVSALVVLLTVLFITPIFYYMPKVTLAALIAVAVQSLFDLDEAKYLWKVKKRDFLTMAITFFLTLIIGVEYGIAVSIGISLLLVIYFSVRPPISILGRMPGTVIYRDVNWYPDAIKTAGGIILRMDAALYFVNSSVLEQKLKYFEKQSSIPLFYVILDFRGINDIDSTGLHLLDDLRESYTDPNRPKTGPVIFCFASVNDRVYHMLEISGFVERLGSDCFFSRVHDAVVFCYDKKFINVDHDGQTDNNNDINSPPLGLPNSPDTSEFPANIRNSNKNMESSPSQIKWRVSEILADPKLYDFVPATESRSSIKPHAAASNSSIDISGRSSDDVIVSATEPESWEVNPVGVGKV